MNRDFSEAVIRGLSQEPKTLPPKYFYNSRGAALFEQICECPEYYVTRTEIGILEERAATIATLLGAKPVLIELGSGASRKTRILLDAIDAAAYVPIDISRDQLFETARQLERDYPLLPVIPICADFTHALNLPRTALPTRAGRRAVFFPGSTIGNFDHAEAQDFLRKIAELAGPDGMFLVGVDLVKPREILELAYDDAAGITARFDLNLLHRIRDELGSQLDPEDFKHLAIYNETESRIEMHLVSTSAQTIWILGHPISFKRGETIHTESSHKYTPARFTEMTERAGLKKRAFWTDPRGYFGVGLFETD